METTRSPPGTADPRVFLLQCMRCLHTAALRLPVLFPNMTGVQKLLTQCGSQSTRQHHHPILVALGFAHDDHMAVKVHILDAQPKPLHQAHSCAVQQLRQDTHVRVEKLEQRGHFLLGQHIGNAALLRRPAHAIQPRQIDAQHFPI